MLKLALFSLLLLSTSTLHARWTGVHFSLGDETIAVESATQNYTLKPYIIQLSVEDKTVNGLRIGANLGQSNSSIRNNSFSESAEAQILGVYVQYPYQINPNLGIFAGLDITKIFAPKDTDEGTINWVAKKINTGISLTLKPFRLTTSINLRDIDGEFQHPTDGFNFKQRELRYSKIDLDYQTDSTSYIRLSFTENDVNSFVITFSRVY